MTTQILYHHVPFAMEQNSGKLKGADIAPLFKLAHNAYINLSLHLIVTLLLAVTVTLPG